MLQEPKVNLAELAAMARVGLEGCIDLPRRTIRNVLTFEQYFVRPPSITRHIFA